VDIYEKIDEIGQYVEQAKIVPVLKQKMVDASYLMKMLEELYASIPAEIKEAREVLAKQNDEYEKIQKESETLLAKTKAECEKLMTIAQTESQRLVDRHEVRSMAEDQARRIQTEVMEEIEMMRQQAIQEIEEMRKLAFDKIQSLEESALHKAREIKIGADQYAEDVLNHIDATVSQIQSVSKSGRKYFIEHRERDIIERATMN
jgi:F0F1-type ATP synthase membrane subunit b/b'